MKILDIIGKIITRGSLMWLLTACQQNPEQQWAENYVYNPYQIDKDYKQFVKPLNIKGSIDIFEEDLLKARIELDTLKEIKKIIYYYPYLSNTPRKYTHQVIYQKKNNEWMAIDGADMKYTHYEYDDYNKDSLIVRRRTSTSLNINNDSIKFDVVYAYNKDKLLVEAKFLERFHTANPIHISYRYNEQKELVQKVERYNEHRDGKDSVYSNYTYKYIPIKGKQKFRLTTTKEEYFKSN